MQDLGDFNSSPLLFQGKRGIQSHVVPEKFQYMHEVCKRSRQATHKSLHASLSGQGLIGQDRCLGHQRDYGVILTTGISPRDVCTQSKSDGSTRPS